ncbi:MAG TPA: acyl-CoA dehydrogenase family protein [Candidatus Binataceae bacterium]|nr:acyl-CoA dehydrogenase family protein [Candidatus Binataceae bacterium]
MLRAVDKNTPIKFDLTTKELRSRVEGVVKVAEDNADSVDRDARFPVEAFAAARGQRLLSLMIPSELGGEGASVSDIADICYMLGSACGSTGMIFAMHQIMAAILVRHAQNSAWHRNLLQRLLTDQLLIASSTTEGQGGGDLRVSVCAVERSGNGISFTKSATVMSYGAQADVILATARRSPDAPPTDQVLLAVSKEDYRLEPIQNWETLGMRGTCSAGFELKARARAEQVLPDSYAAIHAHTMMPVAHLTWGAVWCGIAAGAAERARRFVRAAARRAGGQLPPGAGQLARTSMLVRSLRNILASALQRFEAAEGEQLESLDFQNAMNLLKVNASEMATAAVMNCMHVCGLSGYRNNGEFSVSRYLRDILSSSIMINNDRILSNATTASLLIEVPSSIRG